MKQEPLYLSGLNGIRAIAALAVVISHTTQALDAYGLDKFLFGKFSDGNPMGLLLGGYGVSIFFVLSGFLITYLLQEEHLKSKIDVKKFYIRRILRIWPLYYMYLLIVILMMVFNNYTINFTSLTYYILFSANVPFILDTGLIYLGHYWSLGVEEQFYLVWPWLIKKSKSLLGTVFLLIVILIGAKIVLHILHPNSLLEKIIHVTRFHCMMIGGVGAILYRNKNKIFLSLVNNKLTQSICWVIIFFVAINKYHIISFLDNEILSIVMLCIIVGQVAVTNRMVNLEVKPLIFIGKISYGLYVLHPLVILMFSVLYKNLKIEYSIKYPLVYFSVLGVSIVLSYLSYNSLEKYFLSFKNKFQIIKTRS